MSFRPEGNHPSSNSTNMHLLYGVLPREVVCTENLTPFLKLLPCKGKAGIATLLDGHKLFDASWQSMAIDVRPVCVPGEECTLEIEQTIDMVLDIDRSTRPRGTLHHLAVLDPLHIANRSGRQPYPTTTARARAEVRYIETLPQRRHVLPCRVRCEPRMDAGPDLWPADERGLSAVRLRRPSSVPPCARVAQRLYFRRRHGNQERGWTITLLPNGARDRL